MAAALAELRAVTSRAQNACGSLEIDGALDQVKNLERELDEVKKTAARGELYPLPGESVSLFNNYIQEIFDLLHVKFIEIILWNYLDLI